KMTEGFREGKVVCLVARGVVGRGIDVTNSSHIINYDLPEDPENYVLRIGRTGRMGADGVAIAFVTPEQGKQLTAIELFINKMLQQDGFDDFEAHVPKPCEPEAEEAPKPYVPIFGQRVRRYRRW